MEVETAFFYIYLTYLIFAVKRIFPLCDIGMLILYNKHFFG